MTFNMISERESRIRLAEDCKYLTSKLPFGSFNFANWDSVVHYKERRIR